MKYADMDKPTLVMLRRLRDLERERLLQEAEEDAARLREQAGRLAIMTERAETRARDAEILHDNAQHDRAANILGRMGG